MLKSHLYYMGIAIAVRKNANCLGRKVGAVLVRENRIVATGYNGTPEGVTNCMDGGCVRCKKREQYKQSAGYDVCICVHAEQNALLTAARFGICVDGALAYSTMRPCFDCTKSMLQAKIRGIVYLHDWTHPDKELFEQYELLQDHFPEKVQHFPMEDPDEAWANCLPKPAATATATATTKAKAIARSRSQSSALPRTGIRIQAPAKTRKLRPPQNPTKRRKPSGL